MASVAATTALATAASAAPAQDSIAGTAHFRDKSVRVHVNATSGADGESPRGWWRFDSDADSAYDRIGSVTCLNVSGTSAVLSGLIVRGPGAGTFFLQYVQDLGAPGDTGDNSVTLQTGLANDPGCGTYSGGGIPAEGGNYVVRDAP